ncbi:restriction endonuclease subunit S [Isoptericola sp. BMS4]|uniref:restriction endonuclease subunit S n=1 Tax=Isoptericola sp. BMS4 TaxID=2527875 RepID=UPI00141D9921|nr:restriction endonuclease subunit S [Isoptericola sp. BMS4]
MAEWRNVALGELGEIFDGPHATPTRRDEGPYFLNISSLQSGHLNLGESDHVSDEDFVRWTRRVTPAEGDLLFSYETRLGDAALMPAGVDACLGRRMALLRPNRSMVDPRFLLYLYLGPQFQQTISQNAVHGATVDRIPLKLMDSWPVCVPELGEQRAIADVLGALDDKIAANAKLATTADELAGALVRAAIDPGRVVALAGVAEITMGSSPAGETFNEQGDGVPFYQGVRDFGPRFPSRRVWTTGPTRWAEAGDLLVSVRAPVGKVNLAPERLCVGRGLAAVRARDDRQATLYHLLLHAPDVWLPFEAEGTVFGSINRAQLHALEIPAVRNDVADEIEGRLAGLEGRIRSSVMENADLTATRDAMLPALMSGKLRVEEAAEVAGL